MRRTIVVTGAASGIGAAATALLRERGVRVITSDLRDADIVADLATAPGRRTFIEGVAGLSGGVVDAVIANAGGGPPETSVQLNFFGAVAALDGLRPLLARSVAPRAVAISSIAALGASRTDLIDACIARDEGLALQVARRLRDEATSSGGDISQVATALYSNSKLALTRWCRRAAPSGDWAGSGILLNVVSLGFYDTPAAAYILDSPTLRDAMQAMVPLRSAFPGNPREAAELLAWLTSPENSQVVGQLIHADGGFECLAREGAAIYA